MKTYRIDDLDTVIWATGAEGHDLLRDSGFAVDE